MMRHIINFVGASPQKSIILKELGNLLPHYEVFTIQDFIQKYETHTPETEEKAWRDIWLAALQADHCVIESIGTSDNLQMILDRLWRAPGTNIVTLRCETSAKVKRMLPRKVAEKLLLELPPDFH
jgi:hypothetical protein